MLEKILFALLICLINSEKIMKTFRIEVFRHGSSCEEAMYVDFDEV